MQSDTPQTNVKRKVLCIEDEPFISDLYVRALERAGYEIKVVQDGDEGLKEAQTNQYDIILLDLMVPGMLGMDILQALRDSQLTPKIKAKIIVTTNLEQSEENRRALEQQADGYLIKAEVTPKELVSFLGQVKQ